MPIFNNYKRLVSAIFLQILLWNSPLAFSKTTTVKHQSQLVIVIDDVGYHQEDFDVFKMPKAVSVAIIPAAPHATARAKKAFQQQRDILIHIPMQPKSDIPIEQGAITVGMNQGKMANLLAISKQKVPNAIGLNNHMGSRATEDQQTMARFMTEFEKLKLDFLDSRTIGDSVAGETAQTLGIKSLDRNVFLDDSDKLADVQRQYNKAIQYARQHGTAIVIGHPRPNTIKVLKKGIKNLPKDIKLVKISSLWKKKKHRNLNLIISILKLCQHKLPRSRLVVYLC